MSTGYSVKGTANVSLKINNKPLPPVANFITDIQIITGFGELAPTAVITFQDQQNLLTGPMALNDGTVITLQFGQSKTSRSVELSVVKVVPLHTSFSIMYTVTLILNKPHYLYGANSEAYRGTSMETLQKVCDKVGLSLDVNISTKDNMVWRSVNRSKALFVRDIVEHSYIDDKSAIASSISIDDRLIVRDLFKEIQAKPKYKIYSGSVPPSEVGKDNVFVATEVKPISVTGLTNLLGNYGSNRVRRDSGGELKQVSTIKPPLIKDGLPINQTIHESMQYARMEQTHFDPGVGAIGGSNAHEKYYEASYQNTRGLNLFNQALRVLIEVETPLELFDIVDYTFTDVIGVEERVDTTHSGVYIVGNISYVIKGHHYAEIITLYRCYLSDSGNTPAIGSKNQVASSGKPTNNAADNSSVNYKDPKNAVGLSQQLSNKIKTSTNDISATQASLSDQFTEIANKPKSAADAYIDSAIDQINQLEDRFMQESNSMGIPSMQEKYGAGKDALYNLMNEFGSAKSALEDCGKLNPFQSMSLNFAKINAGKLLRAITSRLDRLDALDGGLLATLNDLISKGDINGSLIREPSLSTSCKQLQTDHLNAAIKDRFPDKCIDKYQLDRLRIPSSLLRKLRRKLERMLRDILCLIGS